MKWVSHKVITGSIVFAVTGSPVMSVFSALGSVFPDAVEGFPNEANYARWRKNHRQLSHWFFPYLLVFCVLISLAAFQGPVSVTTKEFVRILQGHGYMQIFLLFVSYFSLGALFHIAQDAICGKVPGVTMEERVGVRLFKVGSPQEYGVVLVVLLAVSLIVKLF